MFNKIHFTSMWYRTCDDCLFNQGVCTLNHDEIFLNEYKENQCEDGTGDIFSYE